MPARRPIVNVDGQLAELPAGDTVVGGGGGGATYEVADWSALMLMSLNGAPTGRIYTVMAPICENGIPGTQWRFDGAVFRPAFGQVVYRDDTQLDGITGGTTAWQFLLQTRFAAGSLRFCSRVRVRGKWQFSGTDPANRTMRMFLGSAGTQADPVFAGASVTGAQRVVSASASFYASSNTGIQGPLSGFTSSATQDYPAGANAVAFSTAANTELTVPDMMANELYLSIGILQGASPTSTVSLAAGGGVIYIE